MRASGFELGKAWGCWGLGFRGLECRVLCLGFRVGVLGFRVQAFCSWSNCRGVIRIRIDAATLTQAVGLFGPTPIRPLKPEALKSLNP